MPAASYHTSREETCGEPYSPHVPLISKESQAKTVSKTPYVAIVVTLVGLAVVVSILYLGFLKGTSPPTKGASNGKLIYTEGIDSAGVRISYTSGPAGMMRYSGCVACHGSTGEGGTYPMMCDVKAADIRYTSLVAAGYNDTTIARAITQGIDESGEQLDPCMPRWQMSTTDLSDLLAYLKELSQ